MDHHGIRMKGYFKTDNIQSTDGVVTIEISDVTGNVAFKKETTLEDNVNVQGTLKVESGSPASDYVLKGDSSGNCSWTPKSVPSGKIILFESNTVINGYTLLTDFNDGLVYITKGSAAGGETGGNNKSGGTWALATSHSHSINAVTNHSHTTQSKVLSVGHMPQHRHTTAYDNGYQNKGAVAVTTFGCSLKTGYDYGDGRSYYMVGHSDSPNVGQSSYSGGGAGHDHGSTYGAGGHDHGGVTGSASLGSSWRPYGRNYTRQRRI